MVGHCHPKLSRLQIASVRKSPQVEARFLFFPEECHWVLGAQNGVLWHREYFKWLDALLK